MSAALYLLILEDRASDAELMVSELRAAGFDPLWERVETEQDYLAHLSPSLDLILADYNLPQFDGLRALQLLKERDLDIPFILVSGSIGEERAVDAMRSGAADYILKDRLARFVPAVEHALEEKRLRGEKKRADAQLAKNQHRFRALIEHAPDAIALLGADYELQYVSPSTERMLGYPVRELIGWDPAQFAHPDELQGLLNLLDEASRKPGRSLPAHYRIRHQDGSWRWLEGTVTNLLDEPDIGAIVFNYRDITEQIEAEAQIRYQAALIENVSDAIISTDTDLMIQSWNRAAEVIYGWPSDEVIGKQPITLLRTQQSPAEAEQALKTLFETGRWQGQVIQRHKNGTSLYILASVSLVRDVNRNPLGIVAVNRDITEQIHAEQALMAGEIKFRGLIENSAEGIVLLSPEGTVLYTSPATTRILGGEPGYWIGGNWLNRVHPQDLPTVTELFTSLLLETGVTRVTQFRYQHLDGAWVWLEGTGTNLLDEPSVRAIVGNFRDITARKRAEQALLQSEEQFRRFFEMGLIGMVISTSSKGILKVNTQLCEILQYSRTELLELNWAQFTHPDDLALEAPLFERVLKREIESYEIDKRFIRKDGSVIYAAISVNSVRSADASQDYFVALLQDITTRKIAEQEVRRRLAELEAINRISAALRSMETLKEMLPMVLDECLSVLGATVGSIWLVDAGREQLNLVTQRDGEFVARPISNQSQGIVGYVRETRRGFISNDFKSDPRTPEAARELTPAGFGGACLPILSGTDLSGILFILVESPRQLNSAEIHLLMALAEMAGNAIHRMRLNAQAQEQVQHLAALRTVDMAISGSMDLDITLNILVDQVVSQLHVHAACVLLLNPYLYTFEYKTGRGFRAKGVERSRFRLGEGLAGRAALEGNMVVVPDLGAAADSAQIQRLANEDFVAYYGVPLITKGRVTGILEIFHREPMNPAPSWKELLQAFAGQAAIAIDNAALFEGMQRSNTELKFAYDETIEGWSRALDLRDHETEGHSQRVTQVTLQLAQLMQVSEKEFIHIRRGALLHDIGKMGVPDNILLKPGPLTEDEWTIMRMHPVYANELLGGIKYLQPAAVIPYAHHEKWDGTGYPLGLKGEQIPIQARLFAVVDVWDALRSDRPYRRAWPEERVRQYIQEQSGKHFDPRAVEAFLALDLLP